MPADLAPPRRFGKSKQLSRCGILLRTANIGRNQSAPITLSGRTQRAFVAAIHPTSPTAGTIPMSHWGPKRVPFAFQIHRALRS